MATHISSKDREPLSGLVERITSGWADQKAIREIMVFVQSHGVGTSRAVRIYKTYRADAIPLVSENPHQVALPMAELIA